MISHISSEELSATIPPKRAPWWPVGDGPSGIIYAVFSPLPRNRSSYGWSQLSIRGRTHQCTRPRAARHGGCDGRSSLTHFPRIDPRLLERFKARVQDRLGQPHPIPILRHRLLGGGTHQLPERRRQG